MPEKKGTVINHLHKTKSKQKKGKNNSRTTMRYMRNKGNAHLDMIDQQILTLVLI
jgi:hypothetical protein